MKVKLDNVNGDLVKDNDTYILTDNNYLNNLTYSRTYLKPGQKTNGHFHDKGDVFLIKAGEFHRVFNKDEEDPCAFTCIFQKYDRESDTAKY